MKGKIDYKLTSLHTNAVGSSFVSFTEIPPFQHLKGDLLHKETRILFVEWVKAKLGKVDLVIGDGAFEVDGQEDKQEEGIVPILQAESWVSFQLLEDNGTFVLKSFNISCVQSLIILYILKCAFLTVTLLKPTESRKTNSERYVLCQGFRTKYADLQWEDLLSALECTLFAYTEERKTEFENFIPYLKKHLHITWKLQQDSLSYLINKCAHTPEMLKPGDNTQGEMEIEACLAQLARNFKEWKFSWVHGLTLQVPCNKFEMKKTPQPANSTSIFLFDNWNQLHQDSTFLSILKNHVNTWITKEEKQMVRIIHVTNGQQLVDINGNTVIAYNSFLQIIQRLPCNTILLVREDSCIQDVMVLPKYPKLFLRERKERVGLLNHFLDHVYWWMDHRPLLPLTL